MIRRTFLVFSVVSFLLVRPANQEPTSYAVGELIRDASFEKAVIVKSPTQGRKLNVAMAWKALTPTLLIVAPNSSTGNGPCIAVNCFGAARDWIAVSSTPLLEARQRDSAAFAFNVAGDPGVPSEISGLSELVKAVETAGLPNDIDTVWLSSQSGLCGSDWLMVFMKRSDARRGTICHENGKVELHLSDRVASRAKTSAQDLMNIVTAATPIILDGHASNGLYIGSRGFAGLSSTHLTAQLLPPWSQLTECSIGHLAPTNNSDRYIHVPVAHLMTALSRARSDTTATPDDFARGISCDPATNEAGALIDGIDPLIWTTTP